MKTTLKYGKRTVQLDLPSGNVDIINPVQLMPPFDQALLPSLLEAAIDHDKLRHAAQIAVAINDKTRPVNYKALLVPLLSILTSYKRDDAQITLYIASGTHRPMAFYELQMMLPDAVVRQYPIHVHDSDDDSNLIYLGETSRGTPIYINKTFHASDYKIVVGNIEPHHFMGYSGGVKTAAIGLAGRKTIAANHSLLLTEPKTAIGEYHENPMRMEVEEIGELLAIDLAVNAVQNNNKDIMQVLCGPPRQVSEAALPLVKELCLVPIRHQYETVIASAGGYPKDINVYQAQKAITNAAKFVADGGHLYLVAECIEGIGNEKLERFMQGLSTTDEVRNKLKQDGFAVGPHKAYLIARDLDRIHIHLISSLSDEQVRLLLLSPVTEPDFVETVVPQRCAEGTVAVLPNAVAAIPYLQMI